MSNNNTRRDDDQFSSNQSVILDPNASATNLIDSSVVTPDNTNPHRQISFSHSGGGGGFFLDSSVDPEESINFDKPNTSKLHEESEGGFFLGKVVQQANQIEERLEMEKLFKIKQSSDPYEVFQMDDPFYPVKEDEMGWMEKFCSENLQGMPSLPTGKCTLFCNLVCWFYFLIFGIVFIGVATNVNQIIIPYGNQCFDKEICQIEFPLETQIFAPSYIYYELSEFYQSHNDFASSIIPEQMLGQDISDEISEKYCKSALYLKDMGRNYTYTSTTGYLFEYDQPANPCGIAAKYIFNDSFVLISPDNVPINLNQSGISFSIDRNYKYQRHPEFQFRQWLDVTNEHSMNWFNIQSLPLVRKLWGRIEEDLPAGPYKIIIMNQFNTTIFNGEKSLILTNLSSFGSKNFSFGILLIVISCLLLASGVFIYSKHVRVEKKYLRDMKYLEQEDKTKKE